LLQRANQKRKKKTWQQKHSPLALIVIGNPTRLFVRPFVCLFDPSIDRLFVCLLLFSRNKNSAAGWVGGWVGGPRACLHLQVNSSSSFSLTP